MLIVTDLLGNSERIVSVRDLQRKRRVNGERELSFTLLRSDIDTIGFDLVQEESEILFDGDTYIIKQLKEIGSGDRTYKQVDAVHAFFPKLIDQYKHETTSGTKTFAQALAFVFDGSGYTYTLSGTYDTESFDNLGDDNRLALFQQILGRYGAEFELVGNIVVVREQIGIETDFQFRYNFNIKTLSRTVDTTNLSTYVKGFGQPLTDSEGTPTGNYKVQGEYYSPNVALYGIREAKAVHDDRVTTIATLNKMMQTALQDTPLLSLELDFLDLRAAGYPFIVPNEGDRVLLIYEPMDLTIVVRLVEIEESFNFYLQPVGTKVTLANLNKDITDTVSQFSRTTKAVDKVVNQDGTVKTDILSDDVKSAVAAVQAARKELAFLDGIRSVDPTNTQHLVAWTANGIGTSEDGGVTYQEAVTGEGVNLSNSYGTLPLANVEGVDEALAEVDGRLDALEAIDGGTRLTALEAIGAGTRLTTLEKRLNSGRGTTAERPVLTTADDGYLYYDRTLLKVIVWSGTAWVNVNGTVL